MRYVFVDAMGNLIQPDSVTTGFPQLLKENGLRRIRFHDLRHSYATAALQSGDSIKAVQEQLGHYSSAFTMDTYADVSQKMRHESQSRMERFFKEVSGK